MPEILQQVAFFFSNAGARLGILRLLCCGISNHGASHMCVSLFECRHATSLSSFVCNKDDGGALRLTFRH